MPLGPSLRATPSTMRNIVRVGIERSGNPLIAALYVTSLPTPAADKRAASPWTMRAPGNRRESKLAKTRVQSDQRQLFRHQTTFEESLGEDAGAGSEFEN